MNRAKPLSIAIAVVIGLVILWMTRSPNADQVNSAPEDIVSSTDIVETPALNESVTEEGVREPAAEIDQPPPRQRRDQEVAAWMQQVGFTTEYNIHFTNREFLEEQALLGDMLAAQMLGYQMSGSERGNEYLTDAARWGSIEALHLLSYSSELVASGKLKTQRESQDSPLDQHEYSIKALEYLFVAEMRGDTSAAPHAIANLFDRISYSEQDIKQACVQAGENYLQLESARMAEGKANFDNTSPPNLARLPNYKEHCP